MFGQFGSQLRAATLPEGFAHCGQVLLERADCSLRGMSQDRLSTDVPHPSKPTPTRPLWGNSLTTKAFLAVIAGFPDSRSPLPRPRHETYLPSLEDPTRPHSRFSRAHEDPGRPGRYSRSPCQGAQAPGCLTPSAPGRPPDAPSPMVSSAQAAANTAAGKRRIWRSLGRADFALALAAPVLAKSAHFALHHVAASPASSNGLIGKSHKPELSTDRAPNWPPDVDNTRSPSQWWLGLVVPKRHARRSVTRSLLKRQMRVQAAGQHHRLPPGQWVIRLRSPFDPGRYTSAASPQLRYAIGLELEQVFARVVTV